ncbi:MAG: LamG-like jellyroll fold domain-containing protein [Planctomycetota bacterium]
MIQPARHRHAPSPRRRRGVAYLVVLFAMMVGVVLAASFLRGANTTISVANNVQTHPTARGVAESGLELAVRHVQSDTDWRTGKTSGQWMTDVAWQGGTFAVRFTDDDGDLADDPADSVTITAIGQVDGVTHRVEALVKSALGETGNFRLLMVVSDTNSPTSNDLAKISLFETWGFTVSTLDDGASSSDYSDGIDTSDLLYLSASADSTLVGARIANPAVPIATDHPGLVDTIGLASADASTTSRSTLLIVDNVHTITEDFSRQEVTVASTSVPVTTFGDNVTAEAYVLATAGSTGVTLGDATPDLVLDVSAKGCLVTLNSGRTDAKGRTAAAKRAALPFAGASFDPTKLDTTGTALVEDTIYWLLSAADLPRPIAHWPLDETFGTTAQDVVGGLDGVRNGGIGFGTGQINYASEFDGIDDHIRVPSHDRFKLTSTLSVSAWAYYDSFKSADNTEIIIRKGEGNPNNWQFTVANKYPELVLEAWDNDGIKANTQLTTGRWYHLAVTWDGSQVKFYIDGELDRTASKTGTVGTDDRDVYIGARASTDQTDGLLDDIRLYDRALSAEEVTQLYEYGLAQAGGIFPTLVASYDFVEQKTAPTEVGRWPLDDSGTGGGGVLAGDVIDVNNKSLIDSYSSTLGAYDATSNRTKFAAVASTKSSGTKIAAENTTVILGDVYTVDGSGFSGNAGTLSGQKYELPSGVSVSIPGVPGDLSATSMGNITLPDDSATLDADATIGADGVLMSGDYVFGDLTIQAPSVSGGATITVTGHTRIDVTDDLLIEDAAVIVVNPGATLAIYVNDSCRIDGGAQVNADSSATDRFTLVHRATSSSKRLEIDEKALVGGSIYSQQEIRVRSGSEVYGVVVSNDELDLWNEAKVHVDLSLPSVGVANPPASESIAANHGEFRSGATGLASGALGSTGTAAEFDGSTGSVVVPHLGTYALDTGAVSLFFYADNQSGNQALFSKDASNRGDGGHLTVDLTGATVRVSYATATADHVLVGGNAQPNRWHHLAVSFGPSGLKTFLNGSQVAANTSVTTGLGASSGGTGNAEPIVIGASARNSAAGEAGSLTDHFDGRIDDVRLFDAEVDATQAARLAAGNDPGESTGEASIAYDGSGFGLPADLTISDVARTQWVAGGGLTIDQAVSLATASPPTKVYDAISATGEFSIHAVFTPANDTQTGPATLVAYGGSGGARNFIVGQKLADAAAGVRTSDTGTYGGTQANGGLTLAPGTKVDLLVTFGQESIGFYENGKLVSTAAQTGALTNWSSAFNLIVAGESGATRSWLGTLHEINVYDRALNATQVANVAAGLPPGNSNQAATTFSATWIETD